MKETCNIVILVICLFWISDGHTSEHSKKEYELIDIGRPSMNIQADWYIFSDLNNKGIAAGYYVDTNNMPWAFKWDKNNGYQKLKSPNNTPCAALSINLKGQILGYFRDSPIDTSPDGAAEIIFPTQKKIVLWDINDTIHTISEWSRDEVYSMRINDDGIVFGQIGRYTDQKYRRYSFEWTYDTGIQVTELEQILTSSSRPNNSGQYAGYYNSNDTGVVIPFVLNRDNTFIDLSKKFEKNLSNKGLLINDLQQIAGIFASKGIGYETFLFSNETGVTILPNLAGSTRSYPCNINNMGIVVGYSNFYEDRQNHSCAVMWIDSKTVFDLNNYLDAKSNFSFLERASLINNAGQILGCGKTKDGTQHSFIMNPIGNPDTVEHEVIKK